MGSELVLGFGVETKRGQVTVLGLANGELQVQYPSSRVHTRRPLQFTGYLGDRFPRRVTGGFQKQLETDPELRDRYEQWLRREMVIPGAIGSVIETVIQVLHSGQVAGMCNCGACQLPIEFHRLMAMPGTRRCISCNGHK